MPVLDHDTAVFDSGSLTSGLPLGGSVHLVLRRNGSFTLSGHAHDSGFDNIDYVLSAVLMMPSGTTFTFQHSGHVEGTIAGLPFGTPNRDDNPVIGGTNQGLTKEFDGMGGAVLKASIGGKDTLIGGLPSALEPLEKAAAAELGKAAAAAVIALIV